MRVIALGALSFCLMGLMGTSLQASELKGFESFYPAGALRPEFRFQNYEQVANAAVFYVISSSNPTHNPLDPTSQPVRMSRCSAAAVSNEGHLLTALHCIQGCLVDKGLWEVRKKTVTYRPGQASAQDPRTMPTAQGDVTYGVVTDNTPSNATCSVQVFGQAVQAQIIYAGTGIVQSGDYDATISEEALAFFRSENIYLGAGDVAVLKVPPQLLNANPTTTKPYCAKIAAAPAQTGDAVWAVGFPGPNQRTRNLGSNGRTLYVSLGSVLRDFRESMIYRELSRVVPQSILERMSDNYRHAHVNLMSTDVAPGNSGGMVVNRAGEVVGVAVSVEDGPRALLDNSELSFMVRSEAVRALLSQKLPAQTVEEIFNCAN